MRRGFCQGFASGIQQWFEIAHEELDRLAFNAVLDSR